MKQLKKELNGKDLRVIKTIMERYLLSASIGGLFDDLKEGSREYKALEQWVDKVTATYNKIDVEPYKRAIHRI